MNLVYEQDVVAFEVGQDGGQVSGALDGRAGGGLDRHPHLVGDDRADGGLAQPWGAVEEEVVEHLLPGLGGFEHDLHALLELLLPDVLHQTPGPQRLFDFFFVLACLSRNQALYHRVDRPPN